MESWIPGPDEYITDAARKDWNPVKWAKSNYVAGHNLPQASMNFTPFHWPKSNRTRL